MTPGVRRSLHLDVGLASCSRGGEIISSLKQKPPISSFSHLRKDPKIPSLLLGLFQMT